MRRKRRFNWMPTFGTATGAGNQATSPQLFVVPVRAALAGATVAFSEVSTAIFPVVLDKPLEAGEVEAAEGDAAGRLQAILGNEWFCERIVGSLFIGLDLPDTGQGTPPAVLVTCGFFVARAGDGGAAGQPIGQGANDFNNYSPLSLNAAKEPWMWRRSWVLGGAVQVGQGLTNFPTANAFYGSLREGTQVDVKSVRRIGNDDRLFFAVSTVACGKNESAAEQVQGSVSGILDVRVLGALRKSKPTGKF